MTDVVLLEVYVLSEFVVYISATSYSRFGGTELLLLGGLKVEIVKSNISGLKISSFGHDHNLEVFVGQLVKFHPALLPKVEVLLLKFPNFYPRQISLALHVNFKFLDPTAVSHLEPEVEADTVVLHNLTVGHI